LRRSTSEPALFPAFCVLCDIIPIFRQNVLLEPVNPIEIMMLYIIVYDFRHTAGHDIFSEKALVFFMNSRRDCRDRSKV